MSKALRTNLFTSGYCFITQTYENHVLYGAFARGVDIVDCTASGSALATSGVRPYSDGTVIYAGDGDGYGNAVWIDHGNNIITGYGHLKYLQVKTDQRVDKNTILGIIGTSGNSTGVHLHFEIRLYKKRWFVEPSREHFWDRCSFNDVSLFNWYDPTSSISSETEPTVENRYKVINKNIQVGAFTDKDKALKELENQRAKIMIFDAYKGVYLDV